MAGRLREPIAVIEAKGKTHMGSDEKEWRRARECNPPFTDVQPPEYLTEKQKEKFTYYADMLLSLRIMSELDTDCLGRYIMAHDLYVGYTKVLMRAISFGDPEEIGKVQNLQSKAFQQAQSSARDLGMTITSRCRIVIPIPANTEDDDL